MITVAGSLGVLPIPSQGAPFLVLLVLAFSLVGLALVLQEFTLLKCISGQTACKLASTGSTGRGWINTFAPSPLTEIILRCVFCTVSQSGIKLQLPTVVTGFEIISYWLLLSQTDCSKPSWREILVHFPGIEPGYPGWNSGILASRNPTMG